MNTSVSENSDKHAYLSYDTYYGYLAYYELYTYYMLEDYKKYFVDNQITRNIYHYSGELENNDNKILLVKYKNSILDKKIIDGTSKIKTAFEDKDRPGVNIVGAYLKDGVFHRLPKEYLNYNENDSKLEISINTNKKTYKPQDEVETNI